MIVTRYVAVISCVALWFISQHLVELEKLLYFVNVWCSDFWSAPLDLAMHGVALCGFEVFFLILFSLAWAPSMQERALAGRFALLLTEGFWLQSSLKCLFGRPRPSGLISGEGGAAARGEVFSFPSGHAFGVTVGWLFFFCRIVPKVPYLRQLFLGNSTGASNVQYGAASLMIALVCVCRVYFAVHFVHDCLAGVCLGLVYLHVHELAFPEPQSRYQHRVQLVAHVAVAVVMLVMNHTALAATLSKHSASGVNFGPWMVVGYAAGLWFAPLNRGHKNEWSVHRILLCLAFSVPMISLILVNKLLLPKDASGGVRVPGPWYKSTLINLGTLGSGMFVFALVPRFLNKFLAS